MMKPIPVFIDGVHYDGTKDAGIALNVPGDVVVRRCKSKDERWKNWYYTGPQTRVHRHDVVVDNGPRYLLTITHRTGLVYYSVAKDVDLKIKNFYGSSGLVDNSIKLREAVNRYPDMDEWNFHRELYPTRKLAMEAKMLGIRTTTVALLLNSRTGGAVKEKYKHLETMS